VGIYSFKRWNDLNRAERKRKKKNKPKKRQKVLTATHDELFVAKTPKIEHKRFIQNGRQLKRDKETQKEIWANQNKARPEHSLVWFLSYYSKEHFLHKPGTELQQEYFKGFRPDFINKYVRYIIEVDGSIHDTFEVQERDRIRDKVFTEWGYKVFHVRPNPESYSKFIVEFKSFLNDFYFKQLEVDNYIKTVLGF